MGGGQNWREGKRGKFCARRSEKEGDKEWETQVYNAYHYKRNEKYSDPLSSPKLFFGFILADFTLLTYIEF